MYTYSLVQLVQNLDLECRQAIRCVNWLKNTSHILYLTLPFSGLAIVSSVHYGTETMFNVLWYSSKKILEHMAEVAIMTNLVSSGIVSNLHTHVQ